MMKAIPTLALVLVAGLAGSSPAQTDTPSEKASHLLAEARAAMDLEGDLENALTLFEKAARDASLSRSERDEALYESALLCRRLQRDARAIEILRRLSASSTPWAAKAKTLLLGKTAPGRQDEAPEKRIRIALGKLYKNTHAKEGLSELRLIGKPAIPFVVKELNAQRDNLVFVGNAVEAIATIGGPQVEGWLATVLADKDIYYRRAVVQKLADPKNHAFTTALEPFFHQLLRDDDKRIVSLVIYAFRSRHDMVTADDFMAVLDRNDARLSISMINTFNGRDYAAADPAFARDAAKKLIALLPGLSEQDERSALQVLRRVCMQQPETASMFLKALVASFSRDGSDEAWAVGGVFPRSGWKKPGTVSARDFLDLARQFPKETFTRLHAQPTDPGRGFQRVRSFVASATSFSRTWDSEDVPAALELLKLGVHPWRASAKLEEWIARNATSEQLPLVAEHILDFKAPRPLFHRLGSEKGREEFLLPLERWIDAHLAPERKLPGNDPALLWSAAAAVVAQRSSRGYRYVVNLVRSNPAFFMPVAESFNKVTDDPAALPFLEELIALPGSDVGVAARSRYPLWVAVFRAGRPASLPALIAGGRLGILVKNSHPANPAKHVNFPFFEPTKFSGAEQARIWKGILEGREEELGGDVDAATWRARRNSHGVADLPPEVQSVILNALFAMAPRDRLAVLSRFATTGLHLIPHRNAFSIRVLRELGPEEQKLVLGDLTPPLNEELVAEVTRLLASKNRDLVFAAMRAVRRLRDSRFAPTIRELLKNSDAGLRSDAVTTLVAIENDRALDSILPLAKDASSSVRWSVFSSFMVIPERRAIPLLVEALRDPVKRVREVAEATLKRLQFYFDQKQRWERWMKGVGLDAGSAADALLQQAATDQPKEVRVTAIRSLGTLGVPETLPILIRFMQEKDPEIARAAKEAVDRINARPEKTDEKPSKE